MKHSCVHEDGNAKVVCEGLQHMFPAALPKATLLMMPLRTVDFGNENVISLHGHSI